MKSVAIGALALCLVPLAAGSASATKRIKHTSNTYKSQPYSYATERQRQNSLAYDNGGYYERIQTAHAFGSRSWWELQNRGGGRR